MSTERSFAVILFTDIVGSTARAVELGDHAWRELLAEHYGHARREIQRFGGREVATTGDGLLAVFPRPGAAIRCAWSLRAVIQKLGLQIRAGIHAGEIEGHGRDIGGITVHVGARVMDLAEPGQILVTGTVRELVAGTGFRFADRGMHALKGVPRDQRLYALEDVQLGPPERTRRWVSTFPARKIPLLLTVGIALVLILSAVLLLNRKPSSTLSSEEILAAGAAPGIAVFPFRVTDPDLEEWREGVMDLVSTNIDGAAGMRAIDSRTVLARLREQPAEFELLDASAALSVAERAGARYAVVGSVTSLGPLLRLSANVYEQGTSNSLGQVIAQGSPDSIIALIDRFSISVLQTVLKGQTAGGRGVDLERVTTSSLPALRAFLEGEVLFRRSQFSAAIPAYQTAVEGDSTFALAFYRLGLAYGWAENVDSDLFELYEDRAMQFINRLPEREAVLVEGALALVQDRPDAVETLRLATRKYPDDPEAWYLLGDTYYHLGHQILVDDKQAEGNFARAINLDPSFSPAYIHALDYAFFHADSGRARELLERYSELAGGSAYVRRFRLLYALAWGNPTQRAAAKRAVDQLDEREARNLIGRLWHPRFLPLATELYSSLRQRDDASTSIPLSLFWINVMQGKRRVALEWLDDPLRSDIPPSYELYWLYNRGWPVPPERLLNALEFRRTDTIAPWRLFYLGAYAADRGRWVDHAWILEQMRAEAHRLEVEGDSLGSRGRQAAILALQGHAAWRRGRRAEAVRDLERARQEVRTVPEGNIVRDWLATLYQELDQLKVAERYMNTYRARHPLVEVSLGRLYERLGDPEKARESYELFLVAWQAPDPELQQYATEARQAITRLRGLRRE